MQDISRGNLFSHWHSAALLALSCIFHLAHLTHKSRLTLALNLQYTFKIYLDFDDSSSSGLSDFKSKNVCIFELLRLICLRQIE